MNLVRSIIVPHTIASETAQKTNSKNHLADAVAVLASIAGRCNCEPGLKVGKKALPPMKANQPPAPNARPKPTAQYAIELTLKLVTTLATTVPTFFMRLKPTSSIAKPACMNITRQPVTMTQTVSAATPAAWVAVLSSAATARGITPAMNAKPAAIKNNGLRFDSAILRSELGIDKNVTSMWFGHRLVVRLWVRRPRSKRVLLTKGPAAPRALSTTGRRLGITLVVWPTRKVGRGICLRPP